jgi:hypothetical protein
MKDKIKKILAQMFLTHIGRIFFVAAPLLIVGGIMSPYGTIGEYIDYKRDVTVFDYMMYVGVLILLVEALIMFYWAGKNTIGDIKNWFKRRKQK